MELVKKYFDDKGKEWGTYKIVCDRCGGSGYQNDIGWLRTDGVGRCFKCEGVGFITKDKRILTDKEKTQRERAKVRKEEKKLEAENKREIMFNKFVEENPITYICIDKKSYDEKEMLKEKGYRWVGNNWIGQAKTNLKSIEVDTKDIAIKFNEYGKIEYRTLTIKEIIENNRRKESKSKYIGNIGEKINRDVVVEKIVLFQTQYGYMHIYLMKDEEENVLVWKTSKLLDVQTNDKIKIMGTVKGHSEYNYTKQTELIRCKIA